MNDNEFIELINLYVDHEISQDDAARLEAEVRSSLQRRRIYSQYCRMQKACQELSAQGNQAVPAHEDAKVVAFPSRFRWTSAVSTVGVAAACVALILAVGRRTAVPTAASGGGLAAQPAAAKPAVAALAPSADLTPVFADRAFALAGPRRPDAFLTGMEGASRLDWIGGIRLAPVERPRASDLQFVAKTDLKPDARIIESPPVSNAPVEMTAFQINH